MNQDIQGELSALNAEVLADIEQVAVELARVAGAEITTSLTRTFTVKYKTSAPGQTAPTDPVSEIDHNVEVFIRKRLAEHFPNHDIIGEEVDLHPGAEHDFIWVIDPIDGTTNFINNFPLFAASIGVLYRGYPIVGALWCSTSHELRSGVYHAYRGGALRFEGHSLEGKGRNPGIKRYLVGDPGGSVSRAAGWDTRVTGSASIECAFVATGILTAARFNKPWIWDVAAGVALIQAAGGEVWTQDQNKWVPLDRFLPPAEIVEQRQATLRDWNQSLILGTPEAVAILRKSEDLSG